MRVALATRILPVALGFHATLQERGHEPVALVTLPDLEGKILGGGLAALPGGLDVLLPARRASLAPLLRAVEAELVVCMGFPWKIPADALAAPAHGWLNGHPSLLPRHRGPIPLSWVIRNGDEETGVTFHRMDAELDTGPIYAQRSMPVGDVTDPDAYFARMGPVIIEAFGEALARLESGDEGTPQGDGGEYETFFTDADVRFDPARTALETVRLAWAWLYAPPVGTQKGLLVDGERVVRASLEELDGARRLECADGPVWVVTEPDGRPSA
jgi:methionyl-tRNA formyltransferase